LRESLETKNPLGTSDIECAEWVLVERSRGPNLPNKGVGPCD
jgi:hypothetical protein